MRRDNSKNLWTALLDKATFFQDTDLVAFHHRVKPQEDFFILFLYFSNTVWSLKKIVLSKVVVKIFESHSSTRFGQDFEVEVQTSFWNWSLVSILLVMSVDFNLGRDSEARFGEDFKFKFSRDTDVWLRFWS